MHKEQLHLVFPGLHAENFNKDSGGIQLAEVNFAQSYAEMQLPITTYVGSKTTRSRKHSSGVQIEHVSLGLNEPQGGITDSETFCLSTVTKLVTATYGQPDNIVHFTSVGAAMNFFTDPINYLRRKQGGPQTVYTLHNYHYAIANKPYDVFESYPTEWQFLHEQESKVISSADAVWVTNPTIAAELSRRFSRNIQYAPNTIGSIENHHIKSVKTDFMIFTTMCRLAKEKNIKRTIEAFLLHAKQHPDARLLVAGSGEEDQALCEYLDSIHCAFTRRGQESIKNTIQLLNQFKIIFLGQVKAAEKRQVWQVTDQFILPSLREVSPLVGLEAMMYGKPIIGSDIPGWADYKNEGAPVATPDPASTESIAAAMDIMSHLTTKEFEKTANTARSTYDKYHAPNVVVPKRLELYKLVKNNSQAEL